jgi:hypothetical protein
MDWHGEDRSDYDVPDISSKDPFVPIFERIGINAVNLACSSGNLELVKLLADNGAELDNHAGEHEDEIGPLQLAVLSNNPDLALYVCNNTTPPTYICYIVFPSEQALVWFLRQFDKENVLMSEILNV